MTEQLKYFQLFDPEFSAADFELLAQKLKSKAFRKGEVIVTPGMVQQELYFVKDGVQMSYFDAGDKIHVVAFTYAPNLCAIPDSFSFQKESEYSLVSLTDSALEFLTYAELQSIFKQSRGVERLFRKMTEAILSGTIQRHMERHALSMEERFLKFCKRSSHLLQLVPHKYIASYLDIDPTNFSKLYNSVRI